MICSTSFSSKFFLLFFFIIAALCSCAAPDRDSTGIMPTGAGEQQSAETVSQGSVPIIGDDLLIAFLPMENLSGTKAPLKDMETTFRTSLTGKGFRLLESDLLEQFRKKHRMRYTGGINANLSQALQEEMGVDAILITSLEAYNELNPSQISLISRLVTSGGQPEIIWMDSIGLSGDQSPGLLDLTLIREPQPLLEKAVEELAGSFAAHFNPKDQGSNSFFPSIPESWRASGPGTVTSPYYRLNRKYLPYDHFRSKIVDPEREYSIAVIPLLNLAVRKNAGNIVMLHYVQELLKLGNFKVIEPGQVREQLLRIRAIMPDGPSLAVSDVLTAEGYLGVDLILSGRVFDYQNQSANPKVDYSVQVTEKNSRKVVFGARTFSEGREGVYFYNFGRVFTAHNLLEEMARTTLQLLNKPFQVWEGPKEYIAKNSDEKVDETILYPRVVATSRIDWEKLF
ncbi:MAG: hypothetical protein OEM01_02555 [Desulfobulbaceae bacterium]|nr:hypothetical protein [Desulfobulbaceae bacterium]